MNTDIHIVDREDQVKWYVDDTALSFYVHVKSDHHKLRDWLAEMTDDRVVISGQGKLPRRGTTDHPTLSIYEQIYQERYRIYFQGERDAMVFKLAWGGIQ